MPITPAQINKAQAIQFAAAHDSAPQVRLIAGPGTGKSFAIEERVKHLLSQGIPPSSIFAVSFTRESSRDLRERIYGRCSASGFPAVSQVSVSTLHSLALRMLKAAGLLTRYIISPIVLDTWEIKAIYDAEFASFSNYTPHRCSEIRREHESFWSTGSWTTPGYFPPNPPITEEERRRFSLFFTPRSSTYCCVLPGEIIRACVDEIAAGTLHPRQLLNIQHLIVDEYQDLNQSDQQLIDYLIQEGIIVFIAGDDDQSIYAFRFALPAGIQSFTAQYPSATSHNLTDCFRCTKNVLQAAVNLISHNQAPNRIPKDLTSMYTASAPPVNGKVFYFNYSTDSEEAAGIASSCASLLQAGIPAREILILLSNSRALSRQICQALSAATVPFRKPKIETFTDTEMGRFVLSLLRIACNSSDYIAYRTILGLQTGVGSATCNSIAQKVVENTLNYQQLFLRPLAQSIFTTREMRAVNGAQSIVSEINGWSDSDSLSARIEVLSRLIIKVFGNERLQVFLNEISHLPREITLEELRDYFWASNDEQEALLLQSVYTRIGLPPPADGFLRDLVRVMTIHGSKGLSASIVFIPGLEQAIIPGNKRLPFPGLVLEAARILYVGVTRARAACILSYSNIRFMNGAAAHNFPSQFNSHFNGTFISGTSAGLSPQDIQKIKTDYDALT